MNLGNNKLYLSDIKNVAECDFLDFDFLKNKSILITGATGLICSFLVDVLMYRNSKYNNNIKIYILSRNEEKILNRFKQYSPEKISNHNKNNLIYIAKDVCEKFEFDIDFDFIIHGASNTHPVLYATDPIGTINTNILGLSNLLDYGIKHNLQRFFMMSSVEVYGENITGKDEFFEDSCGYINCNTLRAGYPESKRLCETLCQAYISKYDTDIVIGRLCRVYGPTFINNDSKAIFQFIKCALNNEDIVLKSKGEQFYSFLYVSDVVSAILKILIDGKKGEAYNIADENSNIKLNETAKILADYVNKKVVFDIPSEVEKKGYSTATIAIMNSNKLKELNWKAKYSIKDGLERTVSIIKEK